MFFPPVLVVCNMPKKDENLAIFAAMPCTL